MIVSGASTIVRGSTSEFQLNSAELLALISNDYYKEEGFWDTVAISYSHIGSKQHQTVAFDYSKLESLSSDKKAFLSFSPSAKAGEWQLNNITIYDQDRGKLLINSKDVPNVATYSITVTES